MDPWLIVKLLALLTAANGSPVILKSIVGDRLACALDAGIRLSDGQPLFGRSKTVRGLVVSILATTACAPLLGFQWYVGVTAGATAMAGDLLSSFVKRRLKLAPSSRASGLDQIPESLLPTLACWPFLPLTILDIGAIVLVFLVGEIAVSWLFFKLGIRDRPY